MDQHAGSLPTSSSYSSLPSIAPQQLQYNAPLPPHTLPPLQGQHGGLSMHSMYGQPMSAPHTPTTSTSNASVSAGNGGFQQMGGQSALRGYHLQGAPYQHPLQSYNAPGSMMPPSSGAMSHTQSIAPTSTSNNKLVPIRPMSSIPSLHGQHGMHPQLQPALAGYGPQSLGQDRDIPTHVVGSQGRRGILPSAPGRPSVGATGTGTTKNAALPAKDADGKFPCPHCTKTYLHAKHLKRHLLRHTGDRPYMCVLCSDTFSRSDILKRHFQKCSIRRGNPTGASHLSAQAHLKKSTSRSAVEDLLRNMNGDPNLVPFGVIPDIPDRRGPDGSPNITEEQVKQEHGSQANSLKRLSSGGGRNRRSLTGPGPSGSNRASFDQNHSGDIPTTMSTSINPQLPPFNMSNGHTGSSFNHNYDFAGRSNGGTLQSQEDMNNMTNGRGTMPIFGSAGNAQQAGVDWSQMFQPGAQDGFMSPFHTNLVPNQIAIKAEPSLTLSNDGLFTGVYPIAGGTDGTGSTGATIAGWNVPFSQNDPFQQIANQISNFCFPANARVTPQANELRGYLSPINVKHFLEQFTNFQGHFPIIHIPTFCITETYEGLLLAMICVGAVYSDRITPVQVRELMAQAKMAVERDSRVFAAVSWDPACNGNFGSESIGTQKTDLEEMHAMFLLHALFTWHGTPVQREMARRNFPLLTKLARNAGLYRPSTAPGSFSVLHQPNVVVEHFSSSNFNWSAWVEQEKRSRLFYMIFLCDSAMALYFNMQPEFNSFDINLPLPADDAAWDAQTATQCADALGLRGPIATKDSSTKGSGHAKQPEMSAALKALVEPRINMGAGTTNLYSKFILIHALHVQIWQTQRQQLQEVNSANNQALPMARSGTTTPSSQNDWVARGPDGSVSAHIGGNNTSRRATPVDMDRQFHSTFMVIDNALDKWKRAWDEDMTMQYPPSSLSNRRFGFCRDGVHFFYLAKYLLKNRLDWQMAPDQRLTYVMDLLKSVKTWVVSDSAKRGEELGSVSDIDQDYGVSNLTLDMAHLFKPINKQLDSPIPGVHTNISIGMI